jgi:Spy/CpxP family protein refolding chaperone
MKQVLRLSESQEAKLTELRQNFFQESKPVRVELGNLMHDLTDESVRKRPDERKIADLTEKIGRQHARLATLESSHLRDLATVLDHRQMDTLLHMRDDLRKHGGKRG